MRREKELVKSTLILLLGTLLPKFASFITLPIYTKYLTKSEYGLYDLLFTIISLIVPIITLQIQSAAFRKLIEAKEDNEKKNIISTTYFFTIIIAFIFCWLLFLFLYNVNLLIRLIIILFIFLELLMQITLQIVRGLGNNKAYSISSIINSFLNVILVLPLLIKFKMGLLGLIFSLTISLLTAYLFLIFKIKLYSYLDINNFHFYSLKELLKYSLPMIPNSVSWWIVNVSDKFLITFFLGIEQNAVYAAASKFPSLYSLVYNTFNMAWQESASKNTNDKDIEKYYSNTFNLLFSFLTGGMLLLLSITSILFNVLIDSSYNEAYYQIPILYFSLYLLSFSNYFGGIYVAMKKTSKLAISVTIGAIINVIINFLTIRKFGLYAASVSTLISYLIVLICRKIDIQKHYKIEYNYRKILISIPLFVIVGFLYYKKNLIISITNVVFSFIIFLTLNKKILLIVIEKIKNKI